MTRPTYLDEHHPARSAPDRSALRPRPFGVAPDPRAAWVTGLRIDADGHLSEVPIPTTDTARGVRAHVSSERSSEGGRCTGVGVETLDVDLAMWFDEDGAVDGVHNPTASVIVAMFGRPGAIYGPVVFTGWTHPQPGLPCGAVRDVSVAATILLAGVAPTCDPAAATIDQAAEFARLDVEIVPAPRAPSEPTGTRPGGSGRVGRAAVVAQPKPEPEVSYDAQAHTVTVDGDVARCVECEEPAAGLGHPEHHPDMPDDDLGDGLGEVRGVRGDIRGDVRAGP